MGGVSTLQGATINSLKKIIIDYIFKAQLTIHIDMNGIPANYYVRKKKFENP
jgi:hypothetical protein